MTAPTAILTRDLDDGPPDRPEPQTPLLLLAAPAVALLTALAIRTLVLTDLWLDEGYTMAAARRPWTSIEGEHGTMGLYYALISLWAKVSMAPWWIRSFSLVCTAGALVVFTALLRRQWGDAVARWGSLFAAASYLVVGLAWEARSYGLVALLVVTSWYALDRVIADPRDDRWWRASWACCLLIPLTHGVAVLQVGAQLLTVLAIRADRRTVARVLVGQAVMAASFASLWLFGISNEGSWLAPLSLSDVGALVQSLTTPQAVLSLLLVAAAVASAVRCGREAVAAKDLAERFRNVTWIAWGIGTVALVVAVSLLRPVHAPRYLAATAFGVAGLLAVGLRQRPGSERLPYPLFLTLALLVPAGLSGGAPEPPTWSTAVDVVQADLEAGDAFVFPSADTRLPFEVAWQDGGPATAAPIVGVDGELGDLRRFGQGLSTASLARATAERGGRTWVVSQPMSGIADPLPGFLDDPALDAFDQSEPLALDGHITVVLLTPRP